MSRTRSRPGAARRKSRSWTRQASGRTATSRPAPSRRGGARCSSPIRRRAGWRTPRSAEQRHRLRAAVRSVMSLKPRPRVEIEYCTQCRWLLRAAWMAQELLTTFQDEIGELVLIPGTGGIFEVRIEDDNIWSRSARSRFPEMKELKQLVRDRIAPDRDLGHSER